MAQCLTTGGDRDPFLPRILAEIYRADEIELAVAFVKSSGLELIFSALTDAITIRGASLTVLTSDYLEVTDPQVLRKLMLLSERGADIRLFQAGNSQSFHLKTYICLRNQDGEILEGTAFIGSSNISKAALTEGIEWNYRLRFTDGAAHQREKYFQEVREEYSLLLDHPRVLPLDYAWIDAYEKRRVVPPLPEVYENMQKRNVWWCWTLSVITRAFLINPRLRTGFVMN